MELKRKPKGEKVYRGAYKYQKGDSSYCEEEFEVYKDKKELGFSFFAQMYSRVATGELLTIYVDYIVNKEFIPIKVLVEKSLGKEFIQEIYDFNSTTGILDYLFISKDKKHHCVVKTSPKFSITTPCASTSMLHLRTKKEDTTAKNVYSVISSTNQWSFDSEPSSQMLSMERQGTSAENIKIEGQNVQAIYYKLFHTEDTKTNDDLNSIQFLKVYISKYVTIPYQIISPDGEKIQIKYLNDLDRDS